MRLLANAATFTWDLPLFLASRLLDASTHNGAGGNAAIIGPQVADIYALMHDAAQAARSLTASDQDDPFTKAETLLVQGYAAMDRSDAAAALPPLEDFYKAWLADPNLKFTCCDNVCFLGLA